MIRHNVFDPISGAIFPDSFHDTKFLHSPSSTSITSSTHKPCLRPSLQLKSRHYNSYDVTTKAYNSSYVTNKGYSDLDAITKTYTSDVTTYASRDVNKSYSSRDVTSTMCREFFCPCGKKYRSKTSYNLHMRLECGKEPQFQCPYCPKRTHQKISLQKHMFSKHPNQRLRSSQLPRPPETARVRARSKQRDPLPLHAMRALVPTQNTLLPASQTRVPQQRLSPVLAMSQSVQAEGEPQNAHDGVSRQFATRRMDGMIVARGRRVAPGDHSVRP
ncbi:hypothetical protein M8J76_016855 [Diaphorina citri]|nr:hypothetical protein M8J75_000528 [Diaphorina citri]KAI5719938.1 hypothetical protein M8J76_016855 [Diaphorina citri]